MAFELAQVNIGRLAAPVDSPALAGFMAALDPVNAGHRPGTGEAEDRIRYLRSHGPTPHAFNLRVSFPPPGGEGEQPVRGPGEWLCPA
jgi:hypothetical protein